MYHDTMTSTPGIKWGGHYYATRNYLDMVRTCFGKRYFWYTAIKQYLSRGCFLSKLLHNSSINEIMLFKTAVLDAIQRKTGQNETYGPGWSIED